MGKYIDITIRILIQGLVFIMPLFFIPALIIRPGVDNFSKLWLLCLVVPLLIILLLIRGLKKSELIIYKNPLYLPLGILLFFFGLSTIFALDKFSAFWGQFSNSTLPFLGILMFVLLFFFIVQYSSGSRNAQIIKSFLYSYSFIILVSSLLYIGMSGDFLDENSGPAVFLNLSLGHLGEFSIFIVVGFIFLFNLFFFKSAIFKKPEKIFFTIILFLSVLIIILINYHIAWWLLLIGIIIGAILKLWYRTAPGWHTEFSDNKAGWTICLIIILLSVMFLYGIYSSSHPGYTNISENLGLIETLKIGSRTFIDHPIVGIGPDNFNYAFSLYRDVDLNLSEYWHIRYDKGSSLIAEVLGATGILGFLSYLAVFGFIIVSLFRFILDKSGKSHEEEKASAVCLVAPVFVLMILQFIYGLNSVMLFLFYFFLALFMTGYKKEYIKLSDQRVLVMILVIILAFWLTVAGLNTKYVFARGFYKLGALDTGRLIEAIRLDPYRVNYKTALSKAYLGEALDQLSREGDKDLNAIQDKINLSIDAARLAIKSAPYSVVAYETLGLTFRNLSEYISDEGNTLILAFKSASELEPTNPVILTELGKAYFSISDFNNAAISFKRALEMKPDYYEAEYRLALVREKQNDREKAIEILSDLTSRYPRAVVFYDLGRIAHNSKKYDISIPAFKEVIKLNPNHANALFSLASSLEFSGQKEEAVSYYKKVYALNPENEDLAKKIEELEESLK